MRIISRQLLTPEDPKILLNSWKRLQSALVRSHDMKVSQMEADLATVEGRGLRIDRMSESVLNCGHGQGREAQRRMRGAAASLSQRAPTSDILAGSWP